MSVPSGSEGDGDLYKLAVSGDRAAVQALVERYHADLVLYIKAKTTVHAIAEDAVADAWLSFFRHLKGAAEDPAKALNKPDSVRFWLYRTALNAMRDHFRSSSRQSDLADKATAEASVHGLTAHEPDQLAALEGEERRSALRQAFARLTESCRELLTLMSADPPLSYQQVADHLGRPVGSLGPTRQRCLDSLRRQLGVVA